MNSDQSNRDKIITEWFFQDWIGDNSHLPEPEDVFVFMKVLIDVASAHGRLNEFERHYIIGRAAVFGATQDMLNKLQTYQPNPSEDVQNLDLPHVRKTRMGIVYNLFRILSTDHVINLKDIRMIHMYAKKLDVSEGQVQQLQNLFEEEEKLRQKRASLLFPQGFNDALVEYQKLH